MTSLVRPRRPGLDALQCLLVGVAILAAVALPACRRQPSSTRKVIVLGFDGMDYALTRTLLDAGRLPNLAKLAGMGGFAPLATAIPPQSPVAWSNFITGLDAGGHGIFDFIHRDPKTLVPYLSTTRTESSSRTLKFGKWQVPLTGGSIELLRKGEPFWSVLEAQGIETTIVRMPANFPPSGTATRELSGMGTPDVLGTYGTFSYYTSVPFAFAGRTLSGGAVYALNVIDGAGEGTFYGPDNPFRSEQVKVTAPFTVYVDRERPVARIVVGGEQQVLKVGEWSDWISVRFALAPTQSLHGIVRLFLKATQPDFEMYASPINFDPQAPALPISTPPDYAGELAAATGRFYTQGMPEDTKSLKEGVLSPAEFLAQATIAGDENRRQFHHVLGRFERGLLFYYFGNVDQVSHMMWRAMDPGHPAYDGRRDAPFSHVIEDRYVELDGIVGDTLKALDANTTLVVMSDHGFTSWRRSFNLNTWLKDEGYLTLLNPSRQDDPGFFANVDWSRTRAYGLGLNGLYLNLAGREKSGIVESRDRDRLIGEISSKLLAVVDPATGGPAVTKMYMRDRDYHDRGAIDIGPDMLVGYAKGTRGSDESALGSFPPGVLVDNTSAWSGDHCMDHEAVPGVLFTSRPLSRPAPTLQSLGAAILAEFGVGGFPVRPGSEGTK